MSERLNYKKIFQDQSERKIFPENEECGWVVMDTLARYPRAPHQKSDILG